MSLGRNVVFSTIHPQQIDPEAVLLAVQLAASGGQALLDLVGGWLLGEVLNALLQASQRLVGCRYELVEELGVS